MAYDVISEILFKIGNVFIFFNDTATTEIYPLSLHDALPICAETGRVLFLYTPAGAGGFFEEQLNRPAGSINGAEANEIRQRHGTRIDGPQPFFLRGDLGLSSVNNRERRRCAKS